MSLVAPIFGTRCKLILSRLSDNAAAAQPAPEMYAFCAIAHLRSKQPKQLPYQLSFAYHFLAVIVH